MKIARLSAAALLVIASALLAACPGASDATSAAAGKKGKAKGAKDAAVTAVADAEQAADKTGIKAGNEAAADEAAGQEADKAAAPEGTKIAAADHAKAEEGEEGCIYAGTEKGEPGQLECPHGPGEAAAGDGKDGHYGQPFALADARPLAAAIGAKPGETPIQVSGEVEAVCQKKGCWMVVKDGTESARVLMKDHAFAVPMDCRGKKVTIEGTLASRTFTEKQVKHLEKDGGGDPEKVSGERTEHVLTATGVKIQS